MADDELLVLLAGVCEHLVGRVFAGLETAGHQGLSGSQALAIHFLGAGAKTLGELAHLLGVTQQAASRLTHDLEARGLVIRGTDPSDARIRPLELTTAGRAAGQAMRAAEHAAMAAWREIAGAEDLAATARALAAYLKATEPTRQPATRRIRFS